MPYIKREKRLLFDAALSGCMPRELGDLTYCIYILCVDFLHRTHGKYADLASVVGALSCATQELYRRQVAPYEDCKIMENGDV